MKFNKEQLIDSYIFGKGLIAIREELNDQEMYKIYKKCGNIVAITNVHPQKSFEDSGYFTCLCNGGKNVRFMDGEGLFCFGMYGKRTRGFFNKRALIERKDGSLTFLTEKGEELALRLDKASDFCHSDTFAKVVFEGDNNREKYINLDGEILPSIDVDIKDEREI